MVIKYARFALALLAACPAAVHGDPVVDVAPVFGRILEKGLENEQVQVTSLQWARLTGRGLLYLVGVDVQSLERAGVQNQLSPDDLAWENARRELQGKSATKADGASRARQAVDSVRKNLDRFSTRLRMPEGEEVRVALYSSGSDCQSCHADSRRNHLLGLGRIDEAQKAVGFHRHLGQQSLSGHGASSSRDSVVITTRGIEVNGRQEQIEDGAVLATVLGKRLAVAFPDEYWGVDMHGRAGAMALSAGDDWGPVIALNMTFPLRKGKRTGATKEYDLWDETVREIRGDAFTSGSESPTEGPGSGVMADRFLKAVKDVLADFATRVRGLTANQEITVLVFGGGGGKRAAAMNLLTSGKPSTANRQSAYVDWIQRSLTENRAEVVVYPRLGFPRGGTFARSPDFVVRIGAAVIRDAASREERLSKIRVD